MVFATRAVKKSPLNFKLLLLFFYFVVYFCLQHFQAPQRSPNGSSESDSEDNAALNSTLENEVR